MGIKHLWSILGPYCERKSLYELEGKTVAVDLAGWICESMNVVDYFVQPRLYLRNLFFRINHLLQCGVMPVFILEGETPSLKYDVIAKRNEIQFRGAKPREPTVTQTQTQKPADKGRTKFKYVLKECANLITAMGLQCLTGPGEAEAYCAYLNRDGLVHGVLSQDSDCFAYGAKRVYRNFSISSQGNVAAQGGSVDIYDIETVRQTYDIGQNKMVILALLCGCDYCPGVDGIGKDTVLKFFAGHSDDVIMERVKSWRENSNRYTDLEMKVDNKHFCVNCGHIGRVQEHTKRGCVQCQSHQGCDESLWRDQRLAIKAELIIRKRALLDPEFPSEQIIKEFLCRPAQLDPLNLEWRQPKIVQFIRTLSTKLQWPEIYCFQKFFPLCTRWQLLQSTVDQPGSMDTGISPTLIKKKRNPKGILSYEIIWDRTTSALTGLIPDDQLENYVTENPTHGLDMLFSTVEPANLVEKMYPDLVAAFLLSKAKPKKTTGVRRTKRSNGDDGTPKRVRKKKSKNANTLLNDMSGMLDELAAIERESAAMTKRCRDSGRIQTKLSEFVNKVVVAAAEPPNSMNISMIDFDDESVNEDNLNLSALLTDIINRSPKQKHFRGQKLQYEQTTVTKDEISTPKHHTRHKDVENIPSSSSGDTAAATPSLRKTILDRNLRLSTLNQLCVGSSSTPYEPACPVVASETPENSSVANRTELNIEDSFGLENYVPLTKDFKKRLF